MPIGRQTRLLAVPGVAKVVVFRRGGAELQIRWTPTADPYQPRHNLALDDVLAAARQATGIRVRASRERQSARPPPHPGTVPDTEQLATTSCATEDRGHPER